MEQLRNELNPIDSYCFIHKTHINFIEDVLKSGFLLPSEETGNSSYDGPEDKIFMSLVRQNDKIKYDVISDNEPILIFDTKIYLDYGMINQCHFNIGWNYGHINENSIFFNKFEEQKELNLSNNDILQLNLNYIDISLGHYNDEIEAVPLTFNIQNELVLYEKVSLKKYLKYVILSPYSRYRNENESLELRLKLKEKYGELIIDNIEDMKKLKNFINIKSWENLNQYKEFFDMVENVRNKKMIF